MKIKLTELQMHKIQMALNYASDVLRDIKKNPRKGKALADLKALEGAVAALEVFLL